MINFSEDYDFLGLRKNNCIRRLLEADGQFIEDKDPFFSDSIVRVNSNEERKIRILIVTNQKLYLLIQKEKSRTEFLIKSSDSLRNISKIEIAMNNTLLLNIKSNTK